MAKTSTTPRKIAERRQRLGNILPALEKSYPDAQCSLVHASPLELLVATILSAQCTDERVNIVTRDMFNKYRSAKDLAAAPLEQIEKEIQSTGFYRNKAKALKGMASALVEQHHGKVPANMEQLVALPGVGRKTANVVLGNAFGQNVGVVVDTHVARVSGRLGLTDHTDPEKIEQDLMAAVPQEKWTNFSHLLIYHGRQICQARKPKCSQCPVYQWCSSGEKLLKSGKAS